MMTLVEMKAEMTWMTCMTDQDSWESMKKDDMCNEYYFLILPFGFCPYMVESYKKRCFRSLYSMRETG